MKRIFFFLLIAITAQLLNAQGVTVNTDGSAPHASAMLDVKSNNKGLLPPRMNWQQILDIANPAAGLIVYDTDINALRLFNGKAWVILGQRQSLLYDAPGNFNTTMKYDEIGGSLQPTSITTTPDNSIIIGGGFSGTVTIQSQSITGTTDCFLMKISEAGTLIWLKGFANGTGTSVVRNIASDASGNVYVAGAFPNTADFDPGAGTVNLVSAGGYDGYYARFDVNGNLGWVKQIAGVGSEDVFDIAVNGTALFITGTFNGANSNFNPTVLTSNGSDGFLCRYQISDGNLGASGFVKQITGASDQITHYIHVYTGVVLVAGYYSGTIDFGSGITATSAGGGDGYFAQYNFSGTPSFVRSIGGSGSDYVFDIKTDAANNIICVGHFTGTANFSAPITNLLTSSGFFDGFVAKYTSANVFTWVRQISGAGGDDAVAELAVDASDNIYIAGNFEMTASYYSNPLPPSFGLDDAFLIKLSPNSGIQWIQTAGGALNDRAQGLAISANGRLHFLGDMGKPFFDFHRNRELLSSLYLASYVE